MTEISNIVDCRRKRLSGEDRREQILTVAASLFSRKGFNGTTTKEIAEHIGVSEAIIFRHFSTKQELYSAILEYKANQCLAQMWLSCEDPMQRKDDKAVFYSLAYEILDTHHKDPSLLRLLYYCALEGHEIAIDFFNKTRQRVHEKVASYINERVKDGHFRDIDPFTATRAFFSLVFHRATLREFFKDSEMQRNSIQEHANEITDIFLHGICKVEKR